jgi:S-adenosylmethionine hydrolase
VRDIYVPVAAHLCNGVDLSELGSDVAVEALLPGVVPLPRDGGDGSVVAEVLWVNHLGDCQLNIGPDDILSADPVRGGSPRVEVSAGTPPDTTVRVAEWVAHVGSLAAGAVGVMLDPHGMVSLVLLRRSAADELGIGVGDQVTVRLVDGAQPVSSPVQAPVVRRTAG